MIQATDRTQLFTAQKLYNGYVFSEPELESDNIYYMMLVDISGLV